MDFDNDGLGLQLRSLVKSNGELQLSLEKIATPRPASDEVVLRVEAAPINPSDLGLMFGAADMSAAKASGSTQNPVVTAAVPTHLMALMAGRLDQSMPVGNEGAGVVVAAGASEAAQALLGKTVAGLGGGMYAQYRCLKAANCLVLPQGATPAQGASCFVNPLTALGMVETMRREGHGALVHTAAASNLGQMLNRVCIAEKIPLVNIVRSPEQVEILRSAGAVHVCNSSESGFMDDLTKALAATGATLAFDAIGGGRLANQIIHGMEAVAGRSAAAYSRYGSSVHKQVYIYGMLDARPTELDRRFGLAWGVGGWLLMPFLAKIGPAETQRLKERVAAELNTTFVSNYTKEISLAQALQLDAIAAYGKRATGEKYLINPNK